MKYIIISVIVLLSVILKAQVAITIPAEYEKNDKLVLAWSYIGGIDSVISEITGIAKQVVEVEIIFNPDSNQFDTTQIRNFLADMGVSSENVGFIPATTNTCWLRQYSPVTGYGVFADDLVRYLGNPGFSNYNQSDNDSIPNKLASLWNMELVDYNLDFENTNLQYDGLENLFVGEQVIEQNLPMDENEIIFNLNAYFGSDDVVFTPSLTQSGGGVLFGNNQYIKILDYETILVSSIPDSLPDYDIIEDFVSELSLVLNRFGGYYNIIRVMSPPNADGKYPTTQDEEIRTYTNSLILNNIVIVPSFGLPEFDSAAYHMYSKYMNGYEIHMVDSRLLSLNYGGINTLAKEIPQANFSRIIHQKSIGPQSFFSNYNILCLATASDQIEEMWLYYKLNSDISYTRTEIHLVCPQHYGVIEGLSPTDTVHYYIESVSSSTLITYPLSAPEGNFTFWFDLVDVNHNNEESLGYSIVPNPSSGNFKIMNSNQNTEIQISIYNMAGQLVLSTRNHLGSSISIGDILEEGYYTVVVNQGGASSRLKLVIVN